MEEINPEKLESIFVSTLDLEGSSCLDLIDLGINFRREEDNNENDAHSGDTSDTEELFAEVEDAMLGSLQRGLKSISSHAREYMNTCITDENRKNMQSRLETSMLGLLKSEQVVKEIPMIVTSVVDEFVDQMEEEELAAAEHDDDEGDDDKPLHWFKPLHAINEEKMDKLSQKIFKMFNEKVEDFENSLTDDKLKQLPKFAALEEQVALSRNERKVDEIAIVNGAGDANLTAELLSAEVKYHDADDLSDDEFILPIMDPFTKQPMMNPVRNKHCNHVFEEKSVANYIATDSCPKCPLAYCRNERIFQMDHFVKVPKLTEQVRRKNLKDKQQQQLY